MTEEEAIKQIEILKQELQMKYGDDFFPKMYQSLDMAIKVLKKESTEKKLYLDND